MVAKFRACSSIMAEKGYSDLDASEFSPTSSDSMSEESPQYEDGSLCSSDSDSADEASHAGASPTGAPAGAVPDSTELRSSSCCISSGASADAGASRSPTAAAAGAAPGSTKRVRFARSSSPSLPVVLEHGPDQARLEAEWEVRSDDYILHMQ